MDKHLLVSRKKVVTSTLIVIAAILLAACEAGTGSLDGTGTVSLTGTADGSETADATQANTQAATQAATGPAPTSGGSDVNADVLKYHIHNQAVLESSELATVESIVMLNGDPLTVQETNGVIVLNGTVNVTDADNMACNGVVHVIDATLTPPNTAGMAQPTAAPTTPAATPDATSDVTPAGTDTTCANGETIADMLSADPNFSEFVDALEQAGLLSTLDQDGTYTVFAPANEAFSLPESGTPGAGNVTICHATGSATNPYEEISVNQNALSAHQGHGDIIPAPAGGCPASLGTPSDATGTPEAMPTGTVDIPTATP